MEAKKLVEQLLDEAPQGRIARVTAVAVNRNTGQQVGEPRVEEVDLDNNNIFNGEVGRACDTWLDVKKRYEEFWNDLNGKSKEMVFVQSVTMPNGQTQRAPVPGGKPKKSEDDLEYPADRAVNNKRRPRSVR